MANAETTAATWVAHLAGHADVSVGPRLRAHFEAGRITRLCPCGCHSFDLEIPTAARLEPLGEPGTPGKVFEIAFESNADAEVAFLILLAAGGVLHVALGLLGGVMPWVVEHRAVVVGTAAGWYGAFSVARTLTVVSKAVQAEHRRHVALSR